jgi:hypothetical protein
MIGYIVSFALCVGVHHSEPLNVYDTKPIRIVRGKAHERNPNWGNSFATTKRFGNPHRDLPKGQRLAASAPPAWKPTPIKITGNQKVETNFSKDLWISK